MHEKQLFENAGIFSRGFVVDPELAADLSKVGKLPGVVSEYLEQSWQLIELLNLRNVADIPLNDRLHVIACPGLAPPGSFAPQHLRIAADQDCMHKFVTDHGWAGLDQFAGERRLQE